MTFESLTNETKDVNEVFRLLGARYGVTIPMEWRIQLKSTEGKKEKECSLVSGANIVDRECSANRIPLLPWRYERRFVELAKLVSTKTVEDVVMCRFSCTVTSNESLSSVLYREFDLLEYLNDSRIISLYATMSEGKFANILARLENGCVCSVEVGTTLLQKSQATVLDRHEMIGRRGVASDRVVDTQIPQNSIYLYRPGETDVWTDTDSELFGLSADEINTVRAAFDLAAKITRSETTPQQEWVQHERLCRWVGCAFESDRCEQYIVEGVRS